MLKRAVFIVLIQIPFLGLSQEIPENTRYIKYIDAVKYTQGDTADYKRSVSYYDSAWRVLSSTNNLASTLKKGTVRHTIINRPDKKMYSDVNEEGDTTSSIVFLYDEMGNRTHYFQIRKGDTLHRSKSVFDGRGNHIELWRYHKGRYFRLYTTAYDDSNNVVERVYYDPQARITKTMTTERNYLEGTINSFEQISGNAKVQTAAIKIVDGISRSEHLKDSEGLRYGINLIREKGGYTESKEENENLVWLKIYNADGQVTTTINVSYEEYPKL